VRECRVIPVTCGDYRVHFFAHGLRVHRAPGIPHALQGREIHASLGRALRRGSAAAHSPVIAREGGRSSIPEAAAMETISRGVLDRPVKPGDDDRKCCLKIE
jgi:hypothetical protein